MSQLNTQKDNLRNMEERFTYDRLCYQIIRLLYLSKKQQKIILP